MNTNKASGARGPRLFDRASYALSTARGIAIEYDLRKYARIVEDIRRLDYSGADDEALSGMAHELRSRVKASQDIDGELAASFALTGEACRRRLGMDPFDAQLMAGIAMHGGKIAQMQTGEGKTLAAVLPACLNAMSGRSVHVMTANDYLARRDAEWMRPVYELMGLSVASISERTEAPRRKAAYRADITYLTAREGGFDHLRDQLRYDASEIVQGELSMAIVDEADFILVDEARIPLVIAGAAGGDGIDLGRIDRLARELAPGVDYAVDREGRRISILLDGHARIERALGVEGAHEEKGARAFARVYAALHAQCLLRRDEDYVVRDGRVELVDEFTGRIADRRQWPYGIQAALEAKEGLAVRPEGTVYGSISIQHFMGLYEKIAAMTATAVSAAEELAGLYGLATVIIPPVKPVRRIDEPDVVFLTRRAKTRALVREIAEANARGRPVLVGTASVSESQELAEALAEAGVRCEVLNAKNDEREADLIARAGRADAVTISTNMAGRGTDIKLDGQALARGGLYVIGTNRHESRRIDDQLRGRSGRQGEPGSSRFFISLEDPLFERYGVREFLPKSLQDALANKAIDGRPVEDPRVARELERAQSIIEAQNHATRRALRKYTLLVELDRRRVRMLRDEALRNGRLPPGIEPLCATAEIRSVIVQAYICRLDQFWADHLLRVEDIREGIDLERYAGRDPGLEYVNRVGKAFEDGLQDVEESVISAYKSIEGEPGGLSPERMGIVRPSSTWTYQIDDASPARFSLSMIATSNIGTAALVAGPLLALNALAGLVGWIAKRLSRARDGESRGPT